MIQRLIVEANVEWVRQPREAASRKGISHT
jgi:hypothetical protein